MWLQRAGCAGRSEVINASRREVYVQKATVSWREKKVVDDGDLDTGQSDPRE